ncbi:MAG: PaaI family thioesterase, partial [Shewanella sp.]|nr:PaaI family thioesterase [Shewanella sp.]
MSANNSELGTASPTQHAQVKAPIDVQGIVKRATELNDFGHLLEHVPYAKFIGMKVERFGDELIFKLPAKDDNIGNPVLP